MPDIPYPAPAIVTPPVRTLLISDLHLGSRRGRDVLRRPAALRALRAALPGVGRLVLLGDVVELREGRVEASMRAAEPVLRAIADGLDPEAEIILVPGNHDAPLVRGWLRRHGGPTSIEDPIPPDATARLTRVTTWLGRERTSVRYPGVRLTDRIWATHGHYLDRHLLPESAYGVTRGLLGRRTGDRDSPHDYQRPRRPSAGGIEALAARWLPGLPARLVDGLADVLRASTMPGPSDEPVGHLMAPVTSRVLGLQMRRASIPAIAHVAGRLGVAADWVIFGHVHRLGPLPGDDLDQWRGPDGVRIANSGSWVAEPLLVHGVEAPHPYWPGGAIVIDGDGDPRPSSLLDGVALADLRP
jgi:UDP-2,3-diacylglucosamine pyrophosphatase LpxH